MESPQTPPKHQQKPQQPRNKAKPGSRTGNAPKVAEKQIFKYWLALPTVLREPLTQQEFAKAHGVNPVTLSEWKQDGAFMDEVIDLAKRFARQFTVDVLYAMKRSATSLAPGSSSDRKLWLQYMEKFAERQEHTGKDGEPLPPLTIVRAAPHVRRKDTPAQAPSG